MQGFVINSTSEGPLTSILDIGIGAWHDAKLKLSCITCVSIVRIVSIFPHFLHLKKDSVHNLTVPPHVLLLTWVPVISPGSQETLIRALTKPCSSVQTPASFLVVSLLGPPLLFPKLLTSSNLRFQRDRERERERRRATSRRTTKTNTKTTTRKITINTKSKRNRKINTRRKTERERERVKVRLNSQAIARRFGKPRAEGMDDHHLLGLVTLP